MNYRMNSKPAQTIIYGWKRKWLDWRLKIHLMQIALSCYKSWHEAIQVVRSLVRFKQTVNGHKNLRRCARTGSRYYFGPFIPGFPSSCFDRYIRTEFARFGNHHQPVNNLQVLQIAITSRCPLRCEHCFEWDNLNKEDPFSTEQLKYIIRKFREAGLAQVHLTGGEPLIKMDRVCELIRDGAPETEYYIYTSGCNLSPENARRLKEAGATGVIISLDHHAETEHNTFRGSERAYEYAINGVRNSAKAGLVTALSLCVTHRFLSLYNLDQYARLAKKMGVSFVQLLEPKATGHYANSAVTLRPDEIQLLENFYQYINQSPRYRNYPVFLYPGYHQRRVGCMMAGNRILYIDSAGKIDACPFCQNHAADARTLLNGKLQVTDIYTGPCPEFGTGLKTFAAEKLPRQKTTSNSYHRELKRKSMLSE